MNIGIIGGGAIGLLVAGYARLANYPVTIFTRTETQKRELEKNGLFLKVDDHKVENYSVQAKCFSSSNIKGIDFLFVTVKQYHLKSVMQHLENMGTELPPIAFLQNGMSHIPLLEYFSAKCVLVSIVEHGALKENQTTVFHTGQGKMKIGIIRGDISPYHQMIHDLGEVGLHFTYEKDWLHIMKQKLLVNVCINPLTALYGVRNGILADNQYFRKVMEDVFIEAIRVLQLEQHQNLWEHVLSICETTANNRSSMLRDVDLHKETEIESICGYILEEGKKQQVALPTIEFLYHSMKGLELERRELHE